jgi:hypothetical protein
MAPRSGEVVKKVSPCSVEVVKKVSPCSGEVVKKVSPCSGEVVKMALRSGEVVKMVLRSGEVVKMALTACCRLNEVALKSKHNPQVGLPIWESLAGFTIYKWQYMTRYIMYSFYYTNLKVYQCPGIDNLAMDINDYYLYLNTCYVSY